LYLFNSEAFAKLRVLVEVMLHNQPHHHTEHFIANVPPNTPYALRHVKITGQPTRMIFTAFPEAS
jgi:hypothetical protein